MEMKGLIIGIGAAGNKSVINLIEKDVVSSDDVMLINSTLMDIPAKYKEMAYILEGTDGGFGKERTASKEAMIKKLKSGTLPIKEKAAQGYKFVAIVSSTEGGTGSGASTILAQYIQSVVSLPVHLIGFAGFGFAYLVFADAPLGILDCIAVDSCRCLTVGTCNCAVDFARAVRREVVAVGACCNDACAVLAIA